MADETATSRDEVEESCDQYASMFDVAYLRDSGVCDKDVIN
jgi:hypothetical protein